MRCRRPPSRSPAVRNHCFMAVSAAWSLEPSSHGSFGRSHLVNVRTPLYHIPMWLWWLGRVVTQRSVTAKIIDKQTYKHTDTRSTLRSSIKGQLDMAPGLCDVKKGMNTPRAQITTRTKAQPKRLNTRSHREHPYSLRSTPLDHTYIWDMQLKDNNTLPTD